MKLSKFLAVTALSCAAVFSCSKDNGKVKEDSKASVVLLDGQRVSYQPAYLGEAVSEAGLPLGVSEACWVSGKIAGADIDYIRKNWMGTLETLNLQKALFVNDGVYETGIDYNKTAWVESPTTVPFAAFRGFTKLTTLYLPTKVTTLDNFAFSHCPKLTQVIWGKSLQAIRLYAFLGTGLTSVEIPEGVRSIASEAFYGTPLESVILPKSLSSMYDDSFMETFSPKLKYVKVLATTPPLVEHGSTMNKSGNVFASVAAGFKIEVPPSALSAYKAASRWAIHGDNGQISTF